MHEKELIEKSKNGDQEAFNQLVQLYQNRLIRHCTDLVKDEDAARDLVQDAFIKAYNYLTDFRVESSFYTWIWRIAHNLSLNYLKKQKTLPLKEECMQILNQHQEEKTEIDELVAEALETLPQKHREVFELYDLQQIPQKEIAQRLHVPPGTVRSRLHYARKKIREFIEKHHEN